MSTRLQVVVEPEEVERYRRRARSEGTTLSEWVRRVLRHAVEAEPAPSPEGRLLALDRALGCGHPTADIAEMLQEIESGRDLR